MARATFAVDPKRRSLIGKVKIAAKELRLDDDTYRGALCLVTGNMSAADCTNEQLVAVLDHFKEKGFKPKPKKAGQRAAADHAPARKARAMWISLHHLGAIDNPREKALEAFACRQLGCETFQWADQSRCYKLIEALKAIAERHGWPQGELEGDAQQRIRTLKFRLLCAIHARLVEKDLIPAGWSIGQAAFRLCGIEGPTAQPGHWPIELLDLTAQSLGRKLRGE